MRAHTVVAQHDREPDLVVECTDAAPVLADVVGATARDAVVCVTGVSCSGRTTPLDLAWLLARHGALDGRALVPQDDDTETVVVL